MDGQPAADILNVGVHPEDLLHHQHHRPPLARTGPGAIGRNRALPNRNRYETCGQIRLWYGQSGG